MKSTTLVGIVGIVALLFLGACASDPEPVAAPEPAPATPEAPVEPPEEPVAEESAPEDPVQEEPAPEEPAPEEPVKDEPEMPATVEVSDELYDQTFTEVEQTIQELNEIISSQDYTAWQQYLTDAYRRTYSDPEVLAESSQSSVLVRNNIQLESLQDYFTYVVVPSRSSVRLDDLVFVDEQTVEAVMEVRGQRYLLYLLKKVDNRWKIDTF